MKIKTYLALSCIITASLFSCKDDDSRSCVQCNSPQTTSFELCREGSGNASVNGENTGINYDTYLADLQATGVNCGG